MLFSSLSLYTVIANIGAYITGFPRSRLVACQRWRMNMNLELLGALFSCLGWCWSALSACGISIVLDSCLNWRWRLLGIFSSEKCSLFASWICPPNLGLFCRSVPRREMILLPRWSDYPSLPESEPRSRPHTQIPFPDLHSSIFLVFCRQMNLQISHSEK